MQYKTIALELLEQQPETHDRLKATRTLLATVKRLAADLKESHEAWKTRLAQANPGTSESQIATEALEMALNDLQGSLPAE